MPKVGNVVFYKIVFSRLSWEGMRQGYHELALQRVHSSNLPARYKKHFLRRPGKINFR